METSSNPKRFSGIVDILFVDKSNEATICENCQKPLDENDQYMRFFNGWMFNAQNRMKENNLIVI